jgi:hypothetical protein
VATIAARAHTIGLSVHDALWNYPLSVIMQMLHADAVANGSDFDWTNAGDPSQEILSEFDRLSDVVIEGF